MKTEKIAKLTLEIAKQMFVSGIESLKQFALYHYTEEELTKKEFPKEYKKQYPFWSPGYCFNTRENAQAASTLGKLISMRDLWWEIDGNWKPDYNSTFEYKYCIRVKSNMLEIDYHFCIQRVLTFRTKEIAQEFLDTFKEMLEGVKALI